MGKFQTRSGGHVSIYVPWRSTPIEIMEGGTLEADDAREVEALKGSPEVIEIESKKGGADVPQQNPADRSGIRSTR